MRKNADRFNGVTEQELYNKSLDDRIDFNIDIVYVNINPGLYSVYKGHHYSGPGNHFWRCLYDSGLTSKVLKSTEDFKVLDYKMGLMNMIQKPNIKSCQELTSEEIKEAQDSLNKRIKHYKPKIVAFNGKTIYEIYTGSSVDKEFNFGKQPIRFANNQTDTFMFVMPSSSARCSQLPKVADKVPFYLALRKFRDYLNGYIPELSDLEIQFPDFKVALEVCNDQIVNKKSQSDSEDNSIMDEAAPDPTTPLNNHKIKFVRLNNIPFSEIPFDILENLKVQRKLKKNVTIITTTKDLFQKNIKKSNLFTTHSHINPSSDLDTVTSDSSDYNSISNEPTEQPPSKLTSLILNVCNSASNQPSTAVVQVVKAQSPQPIQSLIISSNKTSTNSTIKQILSAPVNKPCDKIKILANQVNKPIQNNKTIQVNDSKKIIIVNQSPIQQTASYETNENDFLIDYELIESNNYTYGEYYTFNDNQTTSQYLNEELNHVVKQFYSDDMPTVDSLSNKRSFSNLNDANVYVHNCRDYKRQCNVNFNNL